MLQKAFYFRHVLISLAVASLPFFSLENEVFMKLVFILYLNKKRYFNDQFCIKGIENISLHKRLLERKIVANASIE